MNWLDAVIRVVIIVLVMTVVVMYLTYGERKIVARFQQRLGPTLSLIAGALAMLTFWSRSARDASPKKTGSPWPRAVHVGTTAPYAGAYHPSPDASSPCDRTSSPSS